MIAPYRYLPAGLVWTSLFMLCACGNSTPQSPGTPVVEMPTTPAPRPPAIPVVPTGPVTPTVPETPVGPVAPDLSLCPAGRPATITALSTRPEYVTDDDVLVDVSPAFDAGSIVATIGNKSLVSKPRAGVAGKTRLLISGLPLGASTIKLAGTAGLSPVCGTLAVVNHPKSGPLFSGPHQTPFVCQANVTGTGVPTDANCSSPTVVRYYYMSAFQVNPTPLADPAAPYPSDLKTTTTSDGKTVPFVIRTESGTINRGAYVIGILDDPHSRPAGMEYRPTEGWNRRLIYFFGGGCSAGYHQGGTPTGFARVEEATIPWILADGYAHIVNSLNEGVVTCNDVISAETLLSTREHFIEAYDLPKWTMGRGGSGGGLMQLLVSQNYPGILDGLVLRITFPDNVTVAPDVADCKLMNRVFGANPALWNESAKQAATGFAASDTCSTWESVFSPALDPVKGCDASIPANLIYDPVARPHGVRCTLQDNYRNIYGVDADNKAPLQYDNEGIQYGLSAFVSGQLTGAQFVDLNRSVGGNTIDFLTKTERSRVDLAGLRTSYRSGRVTNGKQAGLLPIIDINYYVDTIPMFDVHDRVRPFMVRARIRRAYGDDGNHVIWTTNQHELLYNPATKPMVDGHAMDVMRDWLDALANATDQSRAGLIAVKPAAAKDGCFTYSGTRLVEDPAEYNGAGPCDSTAPTHATPCLVAGAPLTGDVLKCQLKPWNPLDYGTAGLLLLPDQIAQLQTVFASGVCDYSKPGVEQAPPDATWLRYEQPFAGR